MFAWRVLGINVDVEALSVEYNDGAEVFTVSVRLVIEGFIILERLLGPESPILLGEGIGLSLTS